MRLFSLLLAVVLNLSVGYFFLFAQSKREHTLGGVFSQGGSGFVAEYIPYNESFLYEREQKKMHLEASFKKINEVLIKEKETVITISNQSDRYLLVAKERREKEKKNKENRSTTKEEREIAGDQKNRSKNENVGEGAINRSAGFGSAQAKAEIEASIYGVIEQCYPKISRQRGEEGVVALSLIIGENQDVREIRLIQSTGYSRLDNCAISAVDRATKNKLFLSALKDGKSIEGEIRLKPIRFELID